MALKAINNGSEHILYDASLFTGSEISDCFSDTFQPVSGDGAGRMPPLFFELADHEYVLKRYARGGLPRFFIRCHYWYAGAEKVRSFAECRFLYALYMRGLPVPRPVAAHYRRRGLFYSGALITRSCRPARPLSQILSERGCGETEWRTINETINQFHDAGVCHADLNAGNILLDETNGKVFLLDFDKAVLKYRPGAWRDRNLKRLRRSLLKLKRTVPGFNFDEAQSKLMFK